MKKKIVFPFMVLILLLALVACGGNRSSGNTGNGTGSTGENSTDLSQEMTLFIGTFKLEDTELAVSTDQAAELIPLWQMLKSLETSDTAANDEITAVVNQITTKMTAQQMEAITAMNLSQQDVMSVMAGISVSAASADSSSSSSSTGSDQGGFVVNFDAGGAGGPPAGGGGSAVSGGGPATGGGPVIVSGGGAGGVGVGEPQMAATQQADSQSGGSQQIPISLLNALIDLLQKKM